MDRCHDAVLSLDLVPRFSLAGGWFSWVGQLCMVSRARRG